MKLDMVLRLASAGVGARCLCLLILGLICTAAARCAPSRGSVCCRRRQSLPGRTALASCAEVLGRAGLARALPA